MSDHEFHSAAQPMSGLQGGMDEAYVQQPRMSDNDMNRRPSADAPVTKDWTNSLKPTAKPTGSNDKVIP